MMLAPSAVTATLEWSPVVEAVGGTLLNWFQVTPESVEYTPLYAATRSRALDWVDRTRLFMAWNPSKAAAFHSRTALPEVRISEVVFGCAHRRKGGRATHYGELTDLFRCRTRARNKSVKTSRPSFHSLQRVQHIQESRMEEAERAA